MRMTVNYEATPIFRSNAIIGETLLTSTRNMNKENEGSASKLRTGLLYL